MYFVFDVDETLILHSGGVPEADLLLEYFKDDPRNIDDMLSMFDEIHEQGGKVILNSRGVGPDIEALLQAAIQMSRGPDAIWTMFVDAIYAGAHEDEISNPFPEDEDAETVDVVKSRRAIEALRPLMSPETFSTYFDPITRTIKDPTVMWAVRKVMVLNNLGVAKEVVYFFDDTAVNVELAKSCGYMNSVCVRPYSDDEPDGQTLDVVRNGILVKSKLPSTTP